MVQTPLVAHVAFKTFLARQKESEVVEGHLVTDHVHMLISISPKYAITQAIGFMA